MASLTSTPIVHLPPFQNYSCTSCGRCCRQPWGIRVDSNSGREILGSQSAEAVSREGYLPIETVSSMDLVGRRPDGSCVFLDSENLCAIHGEKGPESKPLDCQTYPYLLTETPDGFFTSLSFSCPAVVAGYGHPVEHDRTGLERILTEHRAEAIQDEPIGESLEVLQDMTVDWASYLKLEPLMVQAFRPDQPVHSMLRMAVSLATFFHPANPAEELSLSKLDLAASLDLGGFEGELCRMFSTIIISILEREGQPEERQDYSERLAQGENLPSYLYQISLPEFDLMDSPDQMTSQVIARHFMSHLFGKKFLAGPLVSRLLAFACGYTILLFYLQAFRKHDAEQHFSFAALDRAFDLVEASVITHTHSLDGFFLEFENLVLEAVGREFEALAESANRE